MSQTRTGHKPEDWRDDGPSVVVIRHGNGIEAEPIGYMKPILTNRVVLENRLRSKAPQAFSIHMENRTYVDTTKRAPRTIRVSRSDV